MESLHNAGVRFFSISTKRSSICWPRPSYGPAEVQRTQKLNGTRIAGAKPLGAQIGSCTIMFQAGSRYERDDQLGATHFLRVGAGTAGMKFTEFIKTASLQNYGAYLSCSSDRQSISYTLRCPPPLFKDLKPYLVDATKSIHHNWQIDEKRQTVFDDLTRITPDERVMDLIQKASFTGPLANSVFCEEELTDSMDQTAIRRFKEENYRSNGCSVASIGFPFEETVRVADEVELRYDNKLSRIEIPSAPRSGYECYDLGPGSPTWLAVAVPGCGGKDLSCLLKHAVIAAACGTGNVQYGQHELDRTMQSPLGEISRDVYTNLRAFNISYIDHGIFGIVAQTQARSATSVMCDMVRFLSNVSTLTSDHIQLGKQRLKLNLTIHEQDCIRYTEGLALQLANGVEMDNACDFNIMIETLSTDEIMSVAEMLSYKCSLMSFAVVGDVAQTPTDADF